MTGEAIRQLSLASPGVTYITTYMACQAAVPTQSYDPHFTIPDDQVWKPNRYGPDTPNCYAFFPSGGFAASLNSDGTVPENTDLWEDADASGCRPGAYDAGADKKRYWGKDGPGSYPANPNRLWHTVILPNGTKDKIPWGWTISDGQSGFRSSGSYFAESIMTACAQGRYVNFANSNDFALRLWWTNNRMKPDGPTYQYDGWTGFFRLNFVLKVPLRFPGGETSTDDRYRILAYCDESRVRALGSQLGVGGVFQGKQEDFSDFGKQHVGHSRQFRSYIQKADVQTFWNRTLTWTVSPDESLPQP